MCTECSTCTALKPVQVRRRHIIGSARVEVMHRDGRVTKCNKAIFDGLLTKLWRRKLRGMWKRVNGQKKFAPHKEKRENKKKNTLDKH